MLKQDECSLVGISVPACPIPDPKFVVFFAHPSDCQRFFKCSNGVAHCKTCPANLHWNTELNTCDFPFRAGCNPPRNPPKVPPTTTTRHPNTRPPKNTPPPPPVCPAGPLPRCPPIDGKFPTFFAHANDCHWFFKCSHGVPHCKPCPEKLHWNTQLNTCDFPFRAGCNPPRIPPKVPPTTTTRNPNPRPPKNPPRPPCPAGQLPRCPPIDGKFPTFFAHPNDCQWFFKCSHGVPHCMICPDNLHWNTRLRTCDFPFRAGCIGKST